MRHRNKGRKFSITSSHRKALFRNLSNQLILNEIIKTTLPKAKELRSYAEPIINLSKIDTLSQRRLAFSKTNNREVVTKLFTLLSSRYKTRNGGYLRIIKCGYREGDSAPMAYVELVDREIST